MKSSLRLLWGNLHMKVFLKNRKFYEDNNLNLAIGLTVTKDIYDRYIKGYESEVSTLTRSGYILIAHSGTFDFLYYSREILSGPIRVSGEDKSFGQGVYLYHIDSFSKIKGMDKFIPYRGSYTGVYLECVYDCDPSSLLNNKGRGYLKEYLVLDEIRDYEIYNPIFDNNNTNNFNKHEKS